MRVSPQVVRLGMYEGMAAIQREIAEHGNDEDTSPNSYPSSIALTLTLTSTPDPNPNPNPNQVVQFLEVFMSDYSKARYISPQAKFDAFELRLQTQLSDWSSAAQEAQAGVDEEKERIQKKQAAIALSLTLTLTLTLTLALTLTLNLSRQQHFRPL